MSCFMPWKILHIDLSQALPLLSLEERYQGLYLVFWWKNLPLGHRELLANQLPISTAQLANLAVQTITPVLHNRLLAQQQWGDRKATAWEFLSKEPPEKLPEKLPEELPEIPSQNFHPQPSLASLLQLHSPIAHLFALSSASSSTATHLKTSIVICTRERPESLQRCLQSLKHLKTPPYEIIVVDNAPQSDATQQVVAQIPGIHYVVEPTPGLSYARNAGIQNSTGDLIAFTDDDVEVHPDWLDRLQRNFADPTVMSVTGLVLPAQLETAAQVVFEKNLGYLNKGYLTRTFDRSFFEQKKNKGIPVWEIGAGANMAIRSHAFQKLGGYDERLGAGAAGCSEDSEFWYRILAAGWSCRYDPEAVVFHYHRGNLSKLKHQMYQYYRGFVAALLYQFDRYQHWGNLYFLLITLPAYYFSQFLIALKNGFSTYREVLIAGVSGSLAGIVFYFQHRTPKGEFLSLIPSNSNSESN